MKKPYITFTENDFEIEGLPNKKWRKIFKQEFARALNQDDIAQQKFKEAADQILEFIYYGK